MFKPMPHATRRLGRGACALALGAMALTGVVVVSGTVTVASPGGVLLEHHSTFVGMREGSRGDEVREVQRALMAAGVPVPGGADGWFGPATRSALVAFQSRKGLTTSGEVDRATVDALGLQAVESTPATTTPAATSGSASSSPAGVSNGSIVLQQGARGDQVVALQRALMDAGVFVPGGADGYFGPATRTAVSNYQRWNGLPVSGIVDAATAKRLGLSSGAATTAPATTAPATTAPAATPAASTATQFVGMANGSRGDLVKQLQRALIAAGITVRGGADGIFGPMTEAALVSYQKANGLTANGRVDQATANGLGLGGSAPAAPAPSAPPAPSNSYVGLKVGSTGTLVKELQRALMDSGLTLRGGADGVFGNQTKSTLTIFQRLNGTAQTGVVGERDATLLGLGTSSGPQAAASSSGYAVFGERGDRVRQVQNQLLNAGIKFAGGADGVFGAATAGAIMDFQRREGLPVTGKLDDATAARLGAVKAPAPTPPSTAGIQMQVFPVQGRCWFGDTWHAPRGGGRLHEGVDIIAPKGNLLYAVVDGTISRMYFDFPGALAGNGLRVAQPDGTYFTYLHLDSFAEGIEVGTKVRAGDVIGYVGSTGNSATPHLHFEVHPNGGAAVNPYPLVKKIDACNVTAPRG